jgi:hypothetical protein
MVESEDSNVLLVTRLPLSYLSCPNLIATNHTETVSIVKGRMNLVPKSQRESFLFDGFTKLGVSRDESTCACEGVVFAE